MHELGIVNSLLTLALKHAEQSHARRIIAIHLVVGEYAGIVEDAVNYYFGFLSQNTIAAGAQIFYTHVPAQLHCRDCDSLFALQKREHACPQCRGRRVEIVGGREFYMDRLEVA